MTRRKVGRRLAILAAAGLVVAQGSALAATTTQPLRLTKPVNATKADLNPGRTYSSAYLVADPQNPLDVIGSYVDLRTRRCGVIRSTDGGQTWKQLDASPALPSYPYCLSTSRNIYMAPAAFGRNGTVYIATPAWDLQDRTVPTGNTSVQLARSNDLGNTWQTTLVRDARGKTGDQLESNRPVNGIAVDTHTGSDDTVYVTWAYSTPGVTAPNANPSRAVVATSTDGGRTFGPPVDITAPEWADATNRTNALNAVATTTTVPGATTTTTAPPAAGSRAAQANQVANFGGSSPSITVDNKGTVYAFWSSSTANITPSPMTGWFLSKSTDHGKTWTTNQVVNFAPDAGSLGRIAWSPEGGAQGTIEQVIQSPGANVNVSSYGTVYFSQSTDGGKTWTPRLRLPDSPLQDVQASVIPEITVAPNGRLDVSWYDTRDDPGNRGNDVYYTYSTDNGKTWSKNIRVTDQSVSRLYGVWGFNYDMSSPPGMVSTNDYTLFSWDDTRNTDTSFKDNQTVNNGILESGGGVSDIYTADVQFKAVGGGASKAAKVVLAGVVGLLAVGLALTVVALVSKPRSGPMPKKAKAGAKAPAQAGT